MSFHHNRQSVRWTRCALLLILLGAAGVTRGQADLPARQTTEPLVIDGRLDEKAWASATPTEDFSGPLQPDGTVLPARVRTRLRVLWDTENIYLGFECGAAPGPTTLRERDGLLHQEEVVEVFLDFTGRGTDYVELQLSPAGIVSDLFHHWPERPTYPATTIDESQRRTLHSERTWDLAGLKAAAAVVRKGGAVHGWTAEIALPIESLTYEPRPGILLGPGQSFRANFVHYHYDPAPAGGKAVLRQSTWGPVLQGRVHISPMAMRWVRCVEAGPPSYLAGAWQDAARQLVPDAAQAFAKAQPVSRESRFGTAVTLLNAQPKAENNVEAAAQTLNGLVQENPGDNTALAARYYLGRIEQVHRQVPAPRRALEYYESLMHDYPQDPYAQMAGVKDCLLRLYADENVPVAQRLQAGEALAGFFTLPEARRDYHLLMADAYVRFGSDNARLLSHLLAVEAAGHLSLTAQADLFVRLADAAQRSGQTGRAIIYCRKFLAQHTREARVSLVQQRLRELEAVP